MIQLKAAQRAALRSWFQPERPAAALVGPHVQQTGHGVWWADRWPDPRLVIARTGANYALRGDPATLLAHVPVPIEGFIDPDPAFVSILEQVYGKVYRWPRVLFRLDTPPLASPIAANATIRRLTSVDAGAVAQLAPDLTWIAETWDGPAGLAAGGYAWGAFINGRLASVACSALVGETYEEAGVVTEAAYRGRGYSAACSVALCREIQARGHIPAWSTSPDNLGSIRVAEKLGFRFTGDGELYVIGFAPPAAP
ncbi:MAG: GNAT family N-acetyltransferase [Caldilineaceae bacterium]|nr:GNAT family N-acetyltransferase [Caldilineaceae bacterium]